MMRPFEFTGIVAVGLALTSCGGGSYPPLPTSASPPSTFPTSNPAALAQVPRMRTVSGIVREVNGDAIPGVTVSSRPTGPTTTTGPDGTFVVSGAISNYLVFQEVRHVFTSSAMPNDGRDTMSGLVIKMQPSATVSFDTPVVGVISADDLTYSSDLENSYWEGEYHCSPCKEIWVDRSSQTNAVIRLRWSGTTPLSLWTGTYYGSVGKIAYGAAGASELSLKASIFDTFLVGIAYPFSPPPEGVPFELTIEKPAT